MALIALGFVAILAGSVALQLRPETAGAPAPVAGLCAALGLGVYVGGAGRSGALDAERSFIRHALRRYVPESVARDLERHPDKLVLRGETREIVALFSDIEGFTTLSARIAPERLTAVMQDYFEIASALVHAHGGTLDKFVGDAVVAFWGAPVAIDDASDRARATWSGRWTCSPARRRSSPWARGSSRSRVRAPSTGAPRPRPAPATFSPDWRR
jgi:adenylate cyclase